MVELNGIIQVRTGIKGNPANGGNVLSNREALAAFNPSENMMSYIYDTFKWEHCKEDGYDFDDAWGDGGDDDSTTTSATVEAEAVKPLSTGVGCAQPPCL